MTDSNLEVCRITAEACGHEVVYSESGEICTRDVGIAVRGNSYCISQEIWNPLKSPAQMAECVDKLLSLGYWLALDGRAGRYHQSFGRDGVDEGLSSNCPWREFPARALAEVWRRK